MNYAKLAATAAALLLAHGRSVTLVRVTQSGAYDPSTSRQATSTSSLTFNAAMFDMTDFGDTEEDKSLVLDSDKMMLIEPAAAPTSKDKIIFGGQTFEIVGVNAISPAGIPVVYKLHLRA